MIRREPFGGLIFVEQNHKFYHLDQLSFRLIELHFIKGDDPTACLQAIKQEFGYDSSLEEIVLFLEQCQQQFGIDLRKQVGSKSDYIWKEPIHQSHFYAPVNAFWSFTNLCNLNCTHCAWNSSQPLPGELNTGQCEQVLAELACLGVFEVSFSGGEPLAKKQQLLKMASYATSLGFHLGLATNATLIDDRVAGELWDSGLTEVQVSVEGIEAHESIRGRGVWERTVNGIRALRRRNFDITFSVAINKTNFGEIDTIFQIAKEEGIKNVRFVRFIPIGRGERNMEMFEFPLEEEVNLASILWQKRWELYPETIVTFNKHYVSMGVAKNPGLGNIGEKFRWNWDCPSGRSRICIMPQGNLAPCPLIGSLGFSGGNILVSPLKEIWQHSPLFNEIRTEKRTVNGECGACGNWQKCSGGCKASSYAHFGDFMKPDPLCLKKTL